MNSPLRLCNPQNPKLLSFNIFSEFSEGKVSLLPITLKIPLRYETLRPILAVKGMQTDQNKPPSVVKWTQDIWNLNLSLCNGDVWLKLHNSKWTHEDFSRCWNMYCSTTAGSKCWSSPICCTSLSSHWKSMCVSIMGPDSCCKENLGLPQQCQTQQQMHRSKHVAGDDESQVSYLVTNHKTVTEAAERFKLWDQS